MQGRDDRRGSPGAGRSALGATPAAPSTARRLAVAVLVALLLGGGLGVAAATGGVPAAVPGLGTPVRPAAAGPVQVAVSRLDVTLSDPSRWSPARWPYPAYPGRTLPTVVLQPSAPGPWPVIAFAHGYNTTPDDYLPLLQAIATAGYVVVAPAFPGASSALPGTPNRNDIPSQPGDLSLAISWAIAEGATPGSPLAGQVDPNRVGAVGHSDGGITVAALALDTATFDPRVKGTAVLAGAEWPVPGGLWGPINAGPVLVVNGDADAINPWWAGRQVYDAAGGAKAFLTISGGGHFSPYVGGDQAPAVQAALAGFLDATVRDDVTGRSRLAAATAAAPLVLEQVGLAPEPFGSLDGVGGGLGQDLRVRGWAVDPDVPASPIAVHVYVDGALAAVVTADGSRPDIAAVLPEMGGAHGFDLTISGLPDGLHTACAYGINAGYGTQNVLLGCGTAATRHGPAGSLDGADPVWPPSPSTGPTVLVRGWAIDPDTTAPITVHVYVDGAGVAAVTASASRPDVGAVLPAYGAAHGFSVPVAGLADGSHLVCAYGINVGVGGNTLLGCTTAFVDHRPFGFLDRVAVGGDGAVRVQGWTIDPDTAGPVTVHVYVDGSGAAVTTAGTARPDVGAAYPAYGPAHGYDVTLASLDPSWRSLCAYALNAGAGSSNVLLGCVVRP